VTRLSQLGVLAVLALGGAVAYAEDAPVALIGDHPVYADEYAFHSSRLRTEVASRLMREHGVTMAPGFWTTPVDGVTPEDALKQETLRLIARFRVVQELAVGEGLLANVKSYRQLVEDFHQENLRRREMKAKGEIFYGPVQFRQEVWFDIWLEQVIRAMQKKLLNDPAYLETHDNGEAAARQCIEERIESRTRQLLK